MGTSSGVGLTNYVSGGVLMRDQADRVFSLIQSRAVDFWVYDLAGTTPLGIVRTDGFCVDLARIAALAKLGLLERRAEYLARWGDEPFDREYKLLLEEIEPSIGRGLLRVMAGQGTTPAALVAGIPDRAEEDQS